MEKLRTKTPVDGIIPTYITPNAKIGIQKGELAKPRTVYTNPTPTLLAKAVEPIKNKTVYLYGFGAQSSNHARCLRSEGVHVKILGRNKGSSSMKAAIVDGFEVVELNELDPDDVDLMCFGLPDDQQVVAVQQVVNLLDPRKTTLGFFHGMTVHYGLQGFYGDDLKNALDWGWNMIIVAPKGPGNTVWENKQAGGGIACLFGAHEDSPDYEKTRLLAMAYATAIGGYNGAMLETTFKEETETDHYGEQGVLCGVMFYATYFMINILQRDFGYSLEEAQAKVEEEVIKVGHNLRRGGSDYLLKNASEKVKQNAKKWASLFYGQEVDFSDMSSELETIGFDLRRLQPHLSPVDMVGQVISGDELSPPKPLVEEWEGGIMGILIIASDMQYQIGREAGYSAEGMQFEVQQEIALITDCYLKGGLSYMIMRISTTAKHGMYVSGKYLFESQEISIRERFETVLGAIQNGTYAKQTKKDLVDIPRGSEEDWLWKATMAVFESPEEQLSKAARPATRPNFQGEDIQTVFLTPVGTWSYEFHNREGKIIAA
ncbi:hypothetical protein JW758_00935 [Candidatus Peregrinibacteria bacterium]|nr:hypothetical protein [Candidatus Peregrinibacteria bacterium]